MKTFNYFFPNFTTELTVQLNHDRYEIIRCERKPLSFIHHMQDICVQSLKPGNRGKIDQHAFSSCSFIHLLINQ